MNNLIISAYTSLRKKKFFKVLLIIGLCLCMAACDDKPPANWNGRIMVLSVSSDGKYVVSSSITQQIILWNIPKKTYQIIATDANVYSAYFIKHTDDFMYQSNRNNKVYVMNVAGKTLKTIAVSFPSYGEIITANLNDYFAINAQSQLIAIRKGITQIMLYHYCGPGYRTAAPPKGMPYTCLGFVDGGKLFNFALSNNEKYFVTGGIDEYFLWNTAKASLIKDIVENNSDTYATFSPDSQHVISVDEESIGYYYDILGNAGKSFYYKFPNYPELKAYKNNGWENSLSGLVSVKYIDDNHVLVFASGDPRPFNYAALYKVAITPRHYQPKEGLHYIMTPIKYLSLVPTEQSWYPITNSFARNQAVDTSATAHILVMGQAENNGILVYQYDPKNKTLTQIWAPVIGGDKP